MRDLMFVSEVLPRVGGLRLSGEVREELEVRGEVPKVVVVWEVVAEGLTQVWVCMGVRVSVRAWMRVNVW